MNYTPVPAKVREAGESIASHMMDACIQIGMNGLGGCEPFDVNQYPYEEREFLDAYIDDVITSTEAIYLYMRKVQDSVDLFPYNIGDRVYWNDPEGLTSNHGIIRHVQGLEEGLLPTTDTVIMLEMDGGGEAEVLIREISPF